MMIRRFLPVLLLVLTCGARSPLFANADPVMGFLMLPPSPEANGRAGVYTSLGGDDPLGAIMNPAALGLFVQRNMVSTGFYTAGTNWLPGYADWTNPNSRPRQSSLVRAVNFGFNPHQISAWAKHEVPLSLGLGYYDLRQDVADVSFYTDPNSNPVTAEHDRSRAWTFSAGLDYYLRGSVGWTYKFLNSSVTDRHGSFMNPNTAVNHSIEENATDFGILVEAPLVDVARKLSHHNLDIRPGLRPDVTISYGYSRLNKGGEVLYEPPLDSGEVNPLPRMARATFSAGASISSVDEKRGTWRLMAFEWASAGEDLLVEADSRGDFTYQSGLGDISYYRNLILGRSNDKILKQKGWELDFLEVFTVRGGRWVEAGNSGFNTNGFGIRAEGFFKLIRGTNPSLDALAKHFDLHYQRSAMRGYGDYTFLRTVSFEQISLFIR